MSRQVTFDYSKAGSFISEEEIGYMKKLTLDAKETLVSKTGAGNDFLGWIDLPVDYDKEEFARIKAAAAKIRENSDVLVVAGIGGSYLGARAVVEAVKGMYHNELEDGLKIYFCGNSISPTYLNNIISLCKGKRFSINVISKSGTTTETSLAFRVLRELLEKRNSAELEQLMEQRRSYRYHGGESRLRAAESVERYHLGVAAPIVAEGDLMGCVMLLMGEHDAAPTESEQALAQTFAGFLGKQMES